MRADRIARFVEAQFAQIRAGGIRTVARKFGKAASLVLATPAAVLLLLFIRLSRPVRIFRLAPLRSERIGHFCMNTEVYLSELDEGLHEAGTDLFYFRDRVSNAYLGRMWTRTIAVCPAWLSPVPRVAAALGRFLPGRSRHQAPILENDGRDRNGVLAVTKPHLSLTNDERSQGERVLRELGIPEGAEYVCFHVRDAAYLSQQYANVDWGYMSHRDAPIESHLPAAVALAERGYWVVRLGSVVEAPLPATHPRVIDYPTSGWRSEFMDIYLGATCRFFFGTDSGVFAIPAIFRRPIVFSSYSMVGAIHTWGWNYIHVPALLRDRADGRLIGYREIADRRLSLLDSDALLEGAGVMIEHSTSDVVTEAVLEMDDRIAGRWEPDSDDDERQRRCWELLGPVVEHPVRGGIATRIGAGLLRKRPELLE